jgi:hypothetical protein
MLQTAEAQAIYPYGATRIRLTLSESQIHDVRGGGSSHAAWFSGEVHIDGNLSRASGSFKIDHPLDPENNGHIPLCSS